MKLKENNEKGGENDFVTLPPRQQYSISSRDLLSDPPSGGEGWQMDWGLSTGLGLEPPPLGDGRVQFFKVIFHGGKMRNIIVTILPV